MSSPLSLPPPLSPTPAITSSTSLPIPGTPASTSTSGSSTLWQDQILERLRARNVRDCAYAGIIDQYRQLAVQARVLRERNQTLLRAMNTARASGSAGDENAVRTALITSLEEQISRMRDETLDLHKKQSQHAQRLLEMSDTQRQAEDSARLTQEELRRVRDELSCAQRELEASRLTIREKDRFIQELSDDNNALSLELTQTAARNDSLKKDNASLLQRWLDTKNEEVSRMNEANGFWEEMQSARVRVGTAGVGVGSPYTASVSGTGTNGEGLQLAAETSEPPAEGSSGFRRPPPSPGQTRKSVTGKENG
ncbi:ATG16-domain-containing protein [Dacryopinax primogenitus]|uniref:ATG16-domain-containing protein n=1 Tax=Dacryopinax primogenitus (strain DJM 731) TaxID=1858805 RepID=M5FQB5_DACPD|nr:ATG16-domain-containing protein [Dacryopinax primogenitus]EJT99060.1 ATG16-domain-containing protein [Dacryopinax primogenitus]